MPDAHTPPSLHPGDAAARGSPRHTPTLIIHGHGDSRVPFSQGLSLYRALIDVGCETQFLAYPREPHGFREPAHIEHFLSAWSQWYLDRVSVD